MEDFLEYKVCTSCNQRLPATLDYFYHQTVKGSIRKADGSYRFRNPCKECKKAKDREKPSDRDPSTEERRRKVNRAKQRAYQQLANVHRLEFDMYYGKFLKEEGIKLKVQNYTQLERKRAAGQRSALKRNNSGYPLSK